MSSSRSPVAVGKRAFAEFSEKNVSFMAAGIAYNAFVSLAPLLVVLFVVVSIAGGGLEERLVGAAENSLPGPIADVVVEIFSADTGATGASVVGIVVLVWGTLKIFRGLDTAFSEIYETEDENSIVDQVVDGLVVMVSLLIAVLATVALSALVTRVADGIPVFRYLAPVVLFAGLLVALYPMYYRFPDADVGWRDALPGAAFAAVGWAALQALFQVYLVFAGGGTGSFFGGVIVVVTWLYFSGLVLLLGAVLNAVLGEHSSGAPGGVGRGAARRPGDEETTRSLNRAELATYLRDLRTDLTGFHEELAPVQGSTERRRRSALAATVTERDGTLRKVRPRASSPGEAEVVERVRHDDDEVERSVTVRWRTSDGQD